MALAWRCDFNGLALARQGQGYTSPNLAVGAVVVNDDRIVGEGYHRRAGAPHAEVEALHAAGEAAKGVAQVGLQAGIPVTFGVITSDTVEQAIERAGSKAGNKGGEAALAAIEMANLLCQIKEGN